PRDREFRRAHHRESFGQLLPGRATVGGLEDPAAVAVLVAAESAALDVALLLLPQRGVDDVRIGGIDPHVVAAGVLVLVEDLLERLAAVLGAEDAALLVGPVGMAEGGHAAQRWIG